MAEGHYTYRLDWHLRKKVPNEKRIFRGRGFWRASDACLRSNHASRYYAAVIVSFKSGETEALASGRRVKRFESIETVARRKL